MFIILIKIDPHTGYFPPKGWGPYNTRAEAEDAARRAGKLWLRAKVVDCR